MNLDMAARQYGRYTLENIEWFLLSGYRRVTRLGEHARCPGCQHDERSLYRLYNDAENETPLCSECLARRVKARWQQQQAAKRQGLKPLNGWLLCSHCQQKRCLPYRLPPPAQETIVCLDCWLQQGVTL